MPVPSPQSIPDGPIPVQAPARRTRPRDRRDQILRAAGQIFAAKGYHAASLTDIAREVGITPAGLYRHFSSKQNLLGQTLLTGLDTTLARLDAVHPADAESADERLGTFLDLGLEFRGLPRLWQLEVRNLTDEDRAAMLQRVRTLISIIDEAIGRKRPDLNAADSTFLAWVVVSIAASPSYHNVPLPKERGRRLLNVLTEAVLSAQFTESDGDSGAAAGSSLPADDDLQPERLIVAAARLFNTRGYAAVGIEDIGAAVGVTGPAIYHHFESKSDLLNEIIGRNEQWIGHYISRACAEGATPEESLKLLMGYTVRFVSRSPDIAGTALSEARHLPEEQAKRYRRIHRNGVLRWARLLQAAHPELTEEEARVQVQAMTTVVIDAVRNPRLATRPDFTAVLNEIGGRMALATSTSVV